MVSEQRGHLVGFMLRDYIISLAFGHPWSSQLQEFLAKDRQGRSIGSTHSI